MGAFVYLCVLLMWWGGGVSVRMSVCGTTSTDTHTCTNTCTHTTSMYVRVCGCVCALCACVCLYEFCAANYCLVGGSGHVK